MQVQLSQLTYNRIEFNWSIQRLLRNSKILLGHSCVPCCLSNWNAVTLHWITHKPRTNAYFCTIHASVKVVKNEQNNLKEYLSFGKKKTSLDFKSKYICHKESQMVRIFSHQLRQTTWFPSIGCSRSWKYYGFLTLAWFTWILISSLSRWDMYSHKDRLVVCLNYPN